MSTINVTYKGREYTLEYNRATVRQMEQNGFSLDKLGEQPVTMIPMMVRGAFMKNHRFVQPDLIDEIYAHITNKVGNGDENGFIHALGEMYAETVSELVDDAQVDEGNVAVWKVTKG